MNNKIRKYIRIVLEENINNFLDKEEETNTKQLTETSKSKVLGDPLNVKLNQLADELGSDGDNAPKVVKLRN